MGRMMENDVDRILINEEELKKRIPELGRRIAADYAGRELLMVCILRGAAVFYADLARAINLPLHMNFMAVSSYANAVESSGAVRIFYDLNEDISGKDVLIVEDIIDTGLTLKYLCENLHARKPASLKTCCLLDKPARRKVDFTPDYIGFEVPDEFIVGYGIDYAESYRNLPYIAALKREVYEK
jgi:hypoxanthine phosphoribosyltransferase